MILDGEHFSITALGCNEKLSHQAEACLQPKAEAQSSNLRFGHQPKAEAEANLFSQRLKTYPRFSQRLNLVPLLNSAKG